MLNRRLFWIVFAILAMLTAVVQFVPTGGPAVPAAESDQIQPREKAPESRPRPE